ERSVPAQAGPYHDLLADNVQSDDQRPYDEHEPQLMSFEIHYASSYASALLRRWPRETAASAAFNRSNGQVVDRRRVGMPACRQSVGPMLLPPTACSIPVTGGSSVNTAARSVLRPRFLDNSGPAE